MRTIGEILNDMKPKALVLLLLWVLLACKETAKTPLTPPLMPSTPVATNRGSSTITVEWQVVGGAKGYRLYRDNKNIYDGPNLSFKDAGLDEFTQYEYRVSSYNENGESPKSYSLIAFTTRITLLEVVDDDKWANLLPGKWGCYQAFSGKKFYSWTINFTSSSNLANYVSFSNPYEFIDNTERSELEYKIKIEKDIIYTKDGSAFKKFARIAKVSDDEVNLFLILETSSSYSESLPRLFTKISTFEKSKDEVVKSAVINQAISGVWGYTDLTYKNTTFDFSANKNFFNDSYEFNGAKTTYKNEYKISADGIVSIRRWGDYIDPAWKRYKVVLENDKLMKWYPESYQGNINIKPIYVLNKK